MKEIMNIEQIEELINKKFSFLIEDFGFRKIAWWANLDYYNYFEMIYKNANIKIKIYNNSREYAGSVVIFEVRKHFKDGIGLSPLIAFIQQNPQILIDNLSLEMKESNIEDDLAQYANQVKKYIEKILILFNRNNIKDTMIKKKEFDKEFKKLFEKSMGKS